MTSIAEVLRELPEGYEAACYSEKAMQRARGITNPNDLMMLSLMHLLNGCSLMEVSAIASLAKLGEVSNVAFMKRFANSNGWFKWNITRLVSEGMVPYRKPEWLEEYNVKVADATAVVEKGRSKRIYRLHYALDLFSLHSASYRITDEKTGESLLNYDLRNDDLVVGDRIYSTLKGISHCQAKGVQFILRLSKTSFITYDEYGQRIELLDYLRNLKEGGEIAIPVFAKADGETMTPLRVCARMKDAGSMQDTAKRLAGKQSKKQEDISQDTLDFNNYIVLVTSLPSSIICSQILQVYRWRWQVEMYFKRLKSIIGIGQLPKKKPESVFAWLNGKLMIALLIEKAIGSRSFSPQGLVSSSQRLA